MISVPSIAEFDTNTFDNIVDLFASYFPIGDKLLTREYTEWLYLKNPCGPAKIVFVEDAGRWAAFMAMIPINLVSNGVPMSGYYVVNVLVRPEYQGKFLFGKMVVEAKKYVIENNAVLMGHPNALAMKTWQRARMTFCPELRPFLFVPGWKGSSYAVDEINSADQLADVFPVGSPYADEKGGVMQRVDRDYIQWRFLDHPVNRYRVVLLRYRGKPAGLIISRQIKLSLGLLIDIFVPPEYVMAGVRALPWGTVAFMPESSKSTLTGLAWTLPVKKRIPFFFSHYGGADFTGKNININLSASDF
jgi:hypothetical protein